MPKHTFLPEKFDVPPITISIRELWEALVSRKLGTTEWPVRILPSEKCNCFDLVEAALNAAEEAVITDLSSFSLIAHTYDEKKLALVRIPQSYWREESAQISLPHYMGDTNPEDTVPNMDTTTDSDASNACADEGYARMALQGQLFDINPGSSYPLELDGCAVVIVEANAKLWLKSKDIPADSPYFPAALRNNAHPQPGQTFRKGRPIGYVGQQCLEIARKILVERRGLSPVFKQVHLIQEMWKRTPKHWPDNEPSEASMGRYARSAIKQYYAENSEGQN